MGICCVSSSSSNTESVRNHIAYLRRRLERAEDELGTCEPERSERAAVVSTNRIHSPAACQLIA